MRRWSLPTALGLGLICFAQSAFATQPQSVARELIVRYAPAHWDARAASDLVAQDLGENTTHHVQILNTEHGVLKLRFDSEEAFRAAEAELARSHRIANVSENFLYRPAMKLRLREVPNAE